MHHPEMLLILPQELLEKVIDHIDDLPALHACSVVCRAFHDRARFNIFSTIVLDRTTGDHFLALIDAHPDIAQLVRTLTINKGDWREDNRGASRVNYRWMWADMDRVVPALASRFHHLEELRIQAFGWSTIRPTIKAALLPMVAASRRLHLVDCNLAAFTEWDSLLNLTHLTVHRVIWPAPPIAFSAEPTIRKCQLVDLALLTPGKQSSNKPVLQWIHDRCDLSELRTLAVESVTKPEISELGKLFHNTQKQVRSLAFGTMEYRRAVECALEIPPNVFFAHIPFSGMHNLTSLTLGFTGLWFVSLIPEIIQRVPSSLRHLTMGGIHECLIKSYDWKSLDHALTSPALPKLRDVHLHLISTYYDPEVLPNLVICQLPKSDKQGLLRTTCTLMEANIFAKTASAPR